MTCPTRKRYRAQTMAVSLPDLPLKNSLTSKEWVYYRTQNCQSLKKEPSTPMYLDINIKPRGFRKNALTIVDLWSYADKLKIKRRLEASKTKSKVAIDFRSNERKFRTAKFIEKLRFPCI